MATWYSDQRANERSVPPRMNPPYDKGKVRRLFFTYTTDGSEAAGDTIELVKVPAPCRLMGGLLVSEGVGTGVTVNVGDGSTANKFNTGGALDISAAGSDAFGNSIADAFGEVNSSEFTLTLTVAAVTSVTAGKKLYGYIDIVVE